MQINIKDERPIYIQIAEGIEDAILSGVFAEESQIPSITDFSVNYKINPATALKGINILVENGMVYKKRGLGMFISKGSVEKLREKRKNQFFDNYVTNLISEAKRLNLSTSEIVSMIERGFENELY